jgi:hypothetical protein
MISAIKSILSVLNARAEPAASLEAFSTDDLRTIVSQARKLAYIAEGELLNRKSRRLFKTRNRSVNGLNSARLVNEAGFPAEHSYIQVPSDIDRIQRGKENAFHEARRKIALQKRMVSIPVEDRNDPPSF